MLDMSWGEIMVIGGVALIVIGPKDLPKALRTLGQMTTKMRRMAGEVQSQFNDAMREVRMALLEADVNFRVVKDFVARVKEKSIGTDVLDSLSPAQQVIKIVNDELVELLGGANGSNGMSEYDNDPGLSQLLC